MARALFYILLLLSPQARAFIWYDGSPGKIIAVPSHPTVRVSGWVRGIKLTSTTGREIIVKLPRPVPLDQPLTLPAGDWSDLTLILDGPLQVQVDQRPLYLTLPELVVPLDDPSAREIELDWSLPEGPLDPATLPALLQDGALARPAR